MPEPKSGITSLDPDGPAGGLFPADSEEARVLAQNRRDLRTFEDLMEIADTLPDLQGEKVAEAAWRAVDDAVPVRTEVAALILSVPADLIEAFTREGVLDAVGSPPGAVTLASVLEARVVIEELRELGKDEDLLAAVLSKLELEALESDDRFIRSLEQMKRGERGTFPAHFEI